MKAIKTAKAAEQLLSVVRCGHSASMRKAGLKQLAELASDKYILEASLRALEDSSASVRILASVMLSRLGIPARRAIRPLKKLLLGRRAGYSRSAKRIDETRHLIWTIARVGKPAVALSTIYSYLDKDPPAGECELAFETLTSLEKGSRRRYLDLLIHMLDHRDEGMRVIAVRMLARVWDPRALPKLQQLRDRGQPIESFWSSVALDVRAGELSRGGGMKP